MARKIRPRAAEHLVSDATPCMSAVPAFLADFESDATPSIHVSAGASAFLADALAREANARFVRVRVGRL